MDKKQAQEIVKNTFENPFDKVRFISFVKNLLNSIEEATFSYKGNFIPDAYEQSISTLGRIGKYTDGEHKIDILVVKLRRETSIERARTMQRNFIAWYLNGSRGGEMKDAALAAFVSPNAEDWRFSLVKMDYRFEEGKNGRVKVKEEFTPARRWSFLVGKNENSHTAQSKLFPIIADDEHNPTLALLEEAFNIEKVTKEFFEKYRELFLRTKETLDEVFSRDKIIKADFEAKGVNTVDFTKKLLGQIVFLYFLQKKGWFGVQRDAAWSTGSKHFLRELFDGIHGKYENFFNDILEPLFYEALRIDRSHDDDYYSRFNCKIPFLNGGLFDPINNYDWVHTDILLPNELFSNTLKTKEGDSGNGILDIFDRYNFTVKEDEPLEKEVAVDPEMLGKAYEKFNVIRPDNYEEYKKALKSGQKGAENKFNKQYGVYYTPREIVHYMCQQSLTSYLATELEGKVNKEDIDTLIKYGEQVGENEATVETKGRETRTYFYKLPESIRQNAKVVDEKLADIKVCDPAVGSGAFPVGMMSEIVKTRNVLSAFIKAPYRTIYNFKRECIEKSLYVVDIDPGAVEIAKLRLWLSLVVDEEDIRQIKPLPNLDYKIVCGNSLLGVEKNLFNDALFKELERLKPLLFNETSPKKKIEYKKQIDDLISKITDGHTEFDFQVYFSEVFHWKKGFDVVIANPPYVDSETMVKQSPDSRKTIGLLYLTAKGNWDLYIPFWELGFKLLSEKGYAVYITPNKWLSIGYGEQLRSLLNKYVYQIGNCDQIKVFEAGNSPVIVFVSKTPHKEIQIDVFNEIYETKERARAKISVLDNKNWGILLSQNINLVLKINGSKANVGKYYLAENPFTVSEAYEMKKLIDNLKEPEEFKSREFFKFINTGTIDPYVSLWGKKPTTYIKNKYLYPVVERKKIFRKYPHRYKQMITNKIVISGMRHFESILDDKGEIVAGKSTIILKGKNTNENLRVILGILNSKLITFFIKEAYGSLGIDGGINFTADLVENLPLPDIDESLSEKIGIVVDRILAITSDEDYLENPGKQSKVKDLEREIDQMVYKLYGLTEEEIRIVEGE